MGSIINKLFGRGGTDNEDVALGCDMVPAPSVLSTLFDPSGEDVAALPASSGSVGPFTTMAQAPIRDS